MFLHCLLKACVLNHDHVLTGFDEIKDVASFVVCIACDFDTGVDVAQHNVGAWNRAAVFVADGSLHFAAIVLRNSERCSQEHEHEGSKAKPIVRKNHVNLQSLKQKGSWP